MVGGEGDAPNADFCSLTYITAPVSRFHEFAPGEREANARLMAAGPVLLAVAIAARHQLIAVTGLVTNPEHRAHLRRAIALADAAIAQIEGRS